MGHFRKQLSGLASKSSDRCNGGEMSSEPVIFTDTMAWRDLRGLPGAKGYEFKELVCDEASYTSAYSCELVRLDPSDHSVPHIEQWNHTLIFLEGAGEITIKGRTWPV